MSPRRVLIVSPHFPPVNAPDMQRVRTALPHFIAAGWEVTVLTADDPTPTAPVEPELLATVPPAVRVVRAHCFSRRWTRWLGIGNVALRALPFLFLAGCRVLAGRRYDAVYFSTTMFSVLPLGRLWRRLSGVPYVIDLQDPWVTDFYERPGAPRPPGGWKYGVVRGLNRRLEGWTLRRAAHLITVSADYGTQLRTRHPELRDLPWTEL
ncbi:MAG: glycosyltransferase, partial [Opitutaceae bacterium]|nr:glycosyltransferase [Opitutaceae bacterium]